jgi:tripartite ATP-independent transporter DctM subunit
MRYIGRIDEAIASLALVLMAVIPLVEILARPFMGKGIENAPLFVQHMGLVLAMWGAIAAERYGHLTSLGRLFDRGEQFAHIAASVICGVLTWASWQFVISEMASPKELAYDIPVWWLQATMPLGFAILGAKLAARGQENQWVKGAFALLWPIVGIAFAAWLDGEVILLWPYVLLLVAALLCGAPIFVVLGGMALVLFASDGLPLASIALSHYQITVNPSLPALPLFTLAGLVFAKTDAAKRLGILFIVFFGHGVLGTVIAATVLCSFFTAFPGGSGVTMLALGGLLLPLLKNAGYPEQRGISLVTSASALGVLLAPSVPLIMYAIIARVPINTMFLAGLVPAVVMVICLLLFGGYLRVGKKHAPIHSENLSLRKALGQAKWEILAPFVAIGSLVSGLATPTESAALTAIYAVLTQSIAHKELNWRLLCECLSQCAQIIGGVMLILGMALGLTNYLVDAGIPDLAIDWVQGITQNKFIFLLALNVFLFIAGALMEIYAAIVVLVPLLLPLAVSYGIDPVHFGIIFLANMEMGFLCPPAGMNIFFASAVFKQPIRKVAISVLPALMAIFVGTLIISWLPVVATGLPEYLGQMAK